MADITETQALQLSGVSKPTIPKITVGKTFGSAATNFLTSSELLQPDGSSITKACIIGIKLGNGYVEECYIAAGGISGTTITFTTRGLPKGGLDITTSIASNIPDDHDAGEEVFIVNSGIVFEQSLSAIRGDIATGGTSLILGRSLDEDVTIQYRDTGGIKNLFRKNFSTSKAQYSNDGTIWIDIDTAAPANVTVRSVAAGAANNLELYADSGDNDSLVFKDAGGFSLKLYDDTLRLIPQASVEVWKDVTATAVQINEVAGLVGQIILWATGSAPSGWVICDGSTKDSVADTTFAALFAVIGTTYGGTGAADFDLPDLRGRTPIGSGDGDASDHTNHVLADKEGTETHTLLTAEMPAHTHTIDQSAGAAGTTADTPGSDLAGATTPATSSTGGDGAHNNMQPSLTLNFIIKK